MTTDAARATPAMRERHRPAAGRDRCRTAPRTAARRAHDVTAAGERAARPRDRVVVRRDRHRPRRGRPADPVQRRRLARSRCTRRPAGSSPRSPPAPTCAGSCRSSTRRGPTPASTWDDVAAVAVTYGPGLAGSLLVGINFAKALAWVHDLPLVGGQPPRGPRLRGVAARSGRGRAPGAGLPARRARRLGRAHVPRRDARPPDLPAARHDRRRRGGRGVRQGRPAARPRLPGRSGDRGARPRRATARDGVFPRAWLGDSYDSQLLGAQDGRAPDRRRGRAPTRACADDARRAAARGRRRRARVGLPGRRRRRARHEDDPGRRERSAPGRSCSVAASPRTARCASGWPARPRRSASR